MKKFRIKKGDSVVVIAGKDRGKTGLVKKVITDVDRLIVDGINLVTCFNKRERTGLSKKESSIHISNVAHIDPVTARSTKVKFEIRDGKKYIIAKRSGAVIR